MSLKAAIQKTAENWIRHLESGSLDNVVSSWTDDIHYQLHPDYAGVFPMNREALVVDSGAGAYF